MCVSRLSVLVARKLCIFVFFSIVLVYFSTFLFVSCLLPFVCTSCTIFILIIMRSTEDSRMRSYISKAVLF